MIKLKFPFTAIKLTPEMTAIIELYQSGLSMRRVAQLCNTNDVKVLHTLNNCGIPKRPRGAKSGSSNVNWKEGATNLAHAIRNNSKYKSWRRLVYIRGKHTCAICGVVPSRDNAIVLHCDHIKPLCFLIQENHIKTVEDAELCDALWDINNGRILCKNCHRNTNTYGSNPRSRKLQV